MKKEKMKKSVLITDLDNTLFDWFEAWYYSFNAMMTKTAEITGISIETLIKECKPIHQKYGTSEYSFILESLPSIQNIYGDRDTINSELDEAIHCYRSLRKKHLFLYETVKPTLCNLKERGCYIAVYTESKAYYSAFRIKRLEIDGLIDVLFSPEDHEIPIPDEERKRIDLKKTKLRHTPPDELKPNPTLLLDIIEKIGAKKEQCVYIGDSEIKDIEMAQRACVTDVFAHYGTSHFKEHEKKYDLLRKVTHWTQEDVERERQIKKHSHKHNPTYSVDCFEQILDIFDFIKFEKA